MSGVEVAGLALGVLPLFISALEDYQEGLDPIKAFMRWERELPRLIRKLRNQHVHFAQTIRLLLEPITTEFELAEMLSDPGSGRLWKDREMAGKLKDKLQESYEAYQSTIEDIDRIMKKIASKLDLDRAAELSRNDLEALLAANPQKANNTFEFRKRVRFGMNKKTIKNLLDELDDCNKELERFTDRSDKLESVRKTTKPSFSRRLQQIQGYARSLHSVLLSSWTCSCQSYHRTRLQLEQRESLHKSGPTKSKSISNVTCFLVSFSSSGDAEHPWTWQEAEIRVEDEVSSEMPASPKPKPKMAKTVSFGDKPPPPYSAAPEPGSALVPMLQEVQDLCASIQQLYKSATCIGFSLDSKSKLRGVYPVHGVSEKLAARGETISLNQLLHQPPLVNGRPAKLSKKERYSLAVTLASSTLQLHSTPWFPDLFSTKDVLFHQDSAGSRTIDVKHPYVPSKLAEISNGSVASPKTRKFQNKNTVLLALGVALLELYFGMSAEKYQESEKRADEGPFNPWSLCALAYEWTENEHENMSAAFAGAVTHCLRCFSDPSASLQDADFLQAAVEGIVLPLQAELCQFLGKTAP